MDRIRVHLDTDIGGDADDVRAVALLLSRPAVEITGRADQIGAALAGRQAEAFARDERFEKRYGRVHRGLPPDIINFQHDPLACAVGLGWNGVTVETLPLVLEMEGGLLRERIDVKGRPFPRGHSG